MYSASRSIPTVVFIIACCISSQAAFPQGIKFMRYEADARPLAYPALADAGCTKETITFAAVMHSAMAVTNDSLPPCDTSPINVIPVNPCSTANLGRSGCNARRDLGPPDLSALGKAGQTILRAREKVLEILQNENGCTDWLRAKDSNPAATFRTLGFLLDAKGDEFVRESRDLGPMEVFRSPYVAKVYQGDGSFATITLNLKGAFFSGLSRVIEVRKEGGPSSYQGFRLLSVGPYSGNTLNAQVAVLLHEFGHLLDLLPIDEGDQDGKSVHNTNEVLRFCRAEIESKVKRNTFTAARR
jgi:hypothetical protein